VTANGDLRAEEFERLGDPRDEVPTVKIATVLSTEEERYVRIGTREDGEALYSLAADVARGPKYAERYTWTREEIEADDNSPLKAEFSIEVDK
jgi:hypothetical protein